MEKTKRNYFSSTRIAVIALFSALSAVLYIFGFPIGAAFPSWLELNFSDIPALIGTFALGPIDGSIIIFVKILIKLIFKGTSTQFVGELADLIIGAAFVIPAGVIYIKKRTFKGALVALAVGTVGSTAMGMLANRVVLVPFYLSLFYHGNWATLVGTMQALFGENCTQENFYTFYIWCSVLPFNLMRCLIAVAVTLPVYKRISKLINKLNAKLATVRAKAEEKSARDKAEETDALQTAAPVGQTVSAETANPLTENVAAEAEKTPVEEAQIAAKNVAEESDTPAEQNGQNENISSAEEGARYDSDKKRKIVTAAVVAAIFVLLIGGVLLRYFLG